MTSQLSRYCRNGDATSRLFRNGTTSVWSAPVAFLVAELGPPYGQPAAKGQIHRSPNSLALAAVNFSMSKNSAT